MSDRVDHLPLSSLGFKNPPAVPFWPDVSRILKTLLLLALRALETEPAKLGLSVSYTIGGQTHPAYDFLYGGESSLTEAIVYSWWPIAALIALTGAVLGALYPGLRAARQDPIEALAYE